MENQYQKWVNLALIAVGALLAFVFHELTMRLVSLYDLETRVRDIDLVIQGVSLLLGSATFLVLRRHPVSNQFTNEVVEELSRVTWPTQKETSSATVVVIIMVLISGVILGALDYLWTRLLQFIL
jgi:preprotein translocase subunit SecE